MFDRTTRTVVVVGAQWGDEGKGKLVDVLSESAGWVVRYQGGANAGHTVHIADRTVVLHQVPSGILHPGVRCAIGNGAVVDPDTLLAEVDGLVADGIDVEGRLYLSERAHLVLPHHKLLDACSAASRAIGTTGRGIGPAYEDKVARRGVRVIDLHDRARLERLLEAGVAHANALLAAWGAGERATVAAAEAMLERVTPRLLSLAADVGLAVTRAQRSRAAVLLEGAQGSLLDIDHGTYPFVTSSTTTAGGAAVGAGISPRSIDRALGVVKAYTTRVGHGPLPTEVPEPLQSELRVLGHEFGATTGRARRCGWFDAVVVGYAVRVNGLTDLALTKLDVLDTLPEIRLCTAYRMRGEVVTDFPGDPADLDSAEPVYETFPGWHTGTAGARRLSDLPTAARRYLARIEALVGAPATYVSVGSRRDQIIGPGAPDAAPNPPARLAVS